MPMLPQEIIRKKRLGGVLTEQDISAFFSGYLSANVADYQVSAMLMAIVLKGMTPEETAALTLFMRDSGLVLRWDGTSKNIIDKHSTGGVGDKTSLILMPLCILEGLKVPMIAGRGLGHTGGTLDKLESIPGMNVFVPTDKARKLMAANGGVLMGQTAEIAPLDKRLYALRDVTDTVESIPLITASILSKKLAEGIGGLVMDVKFGSGAFMREKSDALSLAQSIASVGRASGVQVRCVLSDMGSPLGDRAGNALEIEETVALLKGHGPASSRELSLELAVEMIVLANPDLARIPLRKKLEEHLTSGKAFDLFCKIIHSQGGDTRVLENTEKLPTAKVLHPVKSNVSGFVSACDVRDLGLAIIELGGGRLNTADKIDPAVGLSSLKRVGDRVEKNEPLCVIHAASTVTAEAVSQRILSAYKVSAAAKPEPLVWQTI